MTIFLLAIVLLGCVALAGYSFGVIRASFSLVGLLLATLLAFPIGHLLAKPLGLLFKDPIYHWMAGPITAFIIVLALVKAAGMSVNQKVDMWYKYKAGDIRLGLWNRLNPRLGLCVGLINGTIYLVLICLVIFIYSYFTTQVTINGNASIWVRMVNTMGRDVESTGMVKIVAALDPMPADYYTAADVVGLIYHNDLLESRLSRYPAFLSLGERPEFQAIADDAAFAEVRMKQPSFFSDVLGNEKAQAIVNNPELLLAIWSAARPNLNDLLNFLHTGTSATFDSEKILGRWSFDINGALREIKRSKPTLTPLEMARLRAILVASFTKTTLTAAPDKQVFIKQFGIFHPATKPKTPPTVDFQNLQGQWASSGDKYQITITDHPSLDTQVDGDRLTLIGENVPLVFERVL